MQRVDTSEEGGVIMGQQAAQFKKKLKENPILHHDTFARPSMTSQGAIKTRIRSRRAGLSECSLTDYECK